MPNKVPVHPKPTPSNTHATHKKIRDGQGEWQKIDREALHRLLHQNNGNVANLVAELKKGGIECGKDKIYRLIKNDPILCSLWYLDGQFVKHEEMPALDAISRVQYTQEGTEKRAELAMRDMDDLLGAGYLHDLGFSEDEVQQFNAFSEFVGHSFAKTIDFTHGCMVTACFRMQKRAQFIHDEILMNDEEEMRWDEHAEKYEMMPKFSEREKLEWQKEYTNLMDQIRRDAEAANQAGLIRVKAELIDESTGGRKRKKRRKPRLKRAPPA